MERDVKLNNNDRLRMHMTKDKVSISFFRNERPLPMAAFVIPSVELHKLKLLVDYFDNQIKAPVKDKKENINVKPIKKFNRGTTL